MKEKAEPDYYEVLGVKRDASLRAIKQAYRDLVRQYHPDTAGDSAQARRRFDLLQEAYEVLSDASKRAQYDVSLPPRKYPVADLDAETLWHEATNLLFERSDTFSKMLEVMGVAVPITVEGNLVVVGVAGKDQYLAGHLETPANRHRIVEALREISGQEMDYRVIEGTSQEDWEWVKRGEGRAARTQSPPAQTEAKPKPARGKEKAAEAKPKAAPPEVTPWELLGRKIHNTWQGTSDRYHPLTRAEFLFICVNWIAEEAQRATEDGTSADGIRREVERAIERAASLLDLPPTVVALEYARGRRRRK